MNFIAEFKEYDRWNKLKWIISMGGMVVTGGLAVYYVWRAVPVEDYHLIAISYMWFFVMLLFKSVPTGKSK